MTTRNWRTKNLHSGCNNSPSICIPYIDPYVPTTLTISTFTNIGDTTWIAPSYVTRVEYLVVGGGGGGGGAYDTGSAGGGGAGLVLIGDLSVIPGNTYNIKVGDGGTGGYITNSGSDGTLSYFDTIIANGGGGGRQSRDANGYAGLGGAQANGLTVPTGGNGAGNNVNGDNGGGGGGNTSAGDGPTFSPAISNGGAGLISSISDSALTYGAGGNGGKVYSSKNGVNASDNTGNGGEGANAVSSDNKTGGKGGSGIVILKYYI